MRVINMSADDLDLFAKDLGWQEIEFIQKHWEAFKRMWHEQDRKFWIYFLIFYRQNATVYGSIKDVINLRPTSLHLIDDVFIFLHENFIDGGYSSAKKLIENIITLAINKDKMNYINAKTLAKDPFYNKDTRDCFRHLFGPPKNESSFIRVFALHEIFTKFGAAVLTCLKRWLTAEELSSDGEYVFQSAVLQEKKSLQSQPICSYCYQPQDGRKCLPSRYSWKGTYILEKMHGRRCGPWFTGGWSQHEDPRFHDPDNPLYSMTDDPESDWRNNLEPLKFQSFYEYVKKHYTTISTEEETPLYVDETEDHILRCLDEDPTNVPTIEMSLGQDKEMFRCLLRDVLSVLPGNNESMGKEALKIKRSDHEALNKIEGENTRQIEGFLRALCEQQLVIHQPFGLDSKVDNTLKAHNEDKWKLKRCAQCLKEETIAKTYRMCKLCKDKHLKSARYYCARDCQEKHWIAKHKLEHKHNLLK